MPSEAAWSYRSSEAGERGVGLILRESQLPLMRVLVRVSNHLLFMKAQ